MNKKQLVLFQRALHVLLMLNTKPGNKWEYMKTDRKWWAVRLWVRMDHVVPPDWRYWEWLEIEAEEVQWQCE